MKLIAIAIENELSNPPRIKITPDITATATNMIATRDNLEKREFVNFMLHKSTSDATIRIKAPFAI